MLFCLTKLNGTPKCMEYGGILRTCHSGDIIAIGSKMHREKRNNRKFLAEENGFGMVVTSALIGGGETK